MKEQAIQKINKIGNVSGIITLVAKVLVGIGVAVLLAAMVVCMMIPKEMIKVTSTGNVAMELDYSAAGITMSDEEMATAKAELEQNVIDGDWEESGFTVVEITSELVRMSGVTKEYEFTMKSVVQVVALALITMVMTFITLMFVGSLCKAFRDCESPFEENVIKKMQNFAYSLIPWAVISTITTSLTESMLNNKVIVNFRFDLRTILIVLVVLVLVYIFKYGAILQQESDETL